MRLDLFLAETRSISRNRARFLIEQGLVKVDGISAKKPALEILDDASQSVEVAEDVRTQYVARSAVKLERFLVAENIRLDGVECLDIGSSTGGFVQVLLAEGAAKVVAVDVGSDQLHVSLRSDARVELHENTDVRDFFPGRTFTFVTADLSFIPLEKVLSDIVRLSSSDARIVLLFKPQFEVGKEHLTKKSYVARNKKSIDAAFLNFRKAAETLGFEERSFRESALPGEAGNREYFFLFSKA
jgi:23S rRNA (cytidine1920-2'-O)/16S rRNA (cytidine1409-2'-O)-methyltransferase